MHDKTAYIAIIDKLKSENDLRIEMEHEFIHEFFDGILPLFKLLLGTKNDKPESIAIISFHIDIDAPTSIMWYLKVKQACDKTDLYITSSYVRDDTGETLLGESAHLYRQQKIEDGVIKAIKREAQVQGEDGSLSDSDPRSTLARDFDKLEPKKGQRFN